MLAGRVLHEPSLVLGNRGRNLYVHVCTYNMYVRTCMCLHKSKSCTVNNQILIPPVLCSITSIFRTSLSWNFIVSESETQNLIDFVASTYLHAHKYFNYMYLMHLCARKGRLEIFRDLVQLLILRPYRTGDP